MGVGATAIRGHHRGMDRSPPPALPEVELLDPRSLDPIDGDTAPDRTVGHAPDLDVLGWFSPDRRPRPWPGDGSVRRVLPWDVDTVRAIVAELMAERTQRRTDRPTLEIAAGSARLVLAVQGVAGRWPGAVRRRRHRHPVPVALVVDPWSALRTELRLERIRPLRRGEWVVRWYDTVHPLLDVVRFE